jgi:hypothetical protein
MLFLVYLGASCADDSGVDILSMYSAVVRSPSSLGLSPCVWSSHEHPRDNIATHYSPRRDSPTPIVIALVLS